MKLLYIHQYFKTPEEPGGTRSYWIAQQLLKKGHEVTMITASSNNKKEKEKILIDGIEVVYLKEAYNQNMSIIARLKAFLGFTWKSIKEAKSYKDIDLVIATSTPLTVGITALYLKKLKKIPYIFEVRDLWPEVPIQMGAIKNPLLKKVLRSFEKTIYTNAEHVVALSPGMEDGVLKYVDQNKVSMIPNMSKIDQFWPREKNLELMKALNLKINTFKIIHFGALGLANGAETIIESAKILKDDDSVEFLFAGGGSQESQLKNIVREYELENVKFLGRFPMEQMSDVVNFCDVSMVSFKDLPILYTNSPNKLFDSLSAGKPIIVNSAGWTKQMVEKYQLGYYVNPNFPEELAERIKYLQKNPEKITDFGNNARNLAITKFDKTILCKRFGEVVESVEEQLNIKI